MTLIQLLQTGGALRYRPPNGFYVVLSGLTIPVSQSEAQAAVKAGRVRPAGISAHGVYVFSLNDKATDVRRVRNQPQAEWCPQRESCARYLQRASNTGPRTSYVMWACAPGGFDSKIKETK